MADFRVGARLEGFKPFQRALRRADRQLAAGLQRELKEVAGRAATSARQRAGERRRSGDEVRGIKPFSRQGAAGVVSSAKHRGFAYPRRLEFEGRDGGRFGPRAVVIPAVEEQAPELERDALGLVERFAREVEGAR